MFILLTGAMQTDRGLSVRSTEIGGEPFVLTIQNQTFMVSIKFSRNQDELETAALFRMYPSKSFGKTIIYLAVLEDNSFERWNDHVDEEVQKKCDRIS